MRASIARIDFSFSSSSYVQVTQLLKHTEHDHKHEFVQSPDKTSVAVHTSSPCIHLDVKPAQRVSFILAHTQTDIFTGYIVSASSNIGAAICSPL